MLIRRTSFQRMSRQSTINSRANWGKTIKTLLVGLEKSQATLVCWHTNNLQGLIVDIRVGIPNANGGASILLLDWLPVLEFFMGRVDRRPKHHNAFGFSSSKITLIPNLSSL